MSSTPRLGSACDGGWQIFRCDPDDRWKENHTAEVPPLTRFPSRASRDVRVGHLHAPAVALQAVILAAGMGRRLGTLTRERPKALLTISPEGHTLLDYQLALLFSREIQPVYIVGGHGFVALESHIRERWHAAFADARVRLARQTDYRRVNNIESFVLGFRSAGPGGLLLNSDVVLHPHILDDALRCIRQAAEESFLVVDESAVLDHEEMKVTLDQGGRVRGLSKSTPLSNAAAEYIGLLYLSTDATQVAIFAASRLLDQGGVTLYYEDALATVLPELALRTVNCSGRPWMEIDTPEDFQRSRRLFQALLRDGVIPSLRSEP